MMYRYSLISAAGLVALLFNAHIAFAAEPSEGTVSPDSPTVEWTGPATTTSNPSGAAGGSAADCRNPTTRQVDPACDVFHLTIEHPQGERFKATITTEPTDAPVSDYDVFVFGPEGDLVGNAQTAGGAETVVLVEPQVGTYEVVVEAWAVAPGTTYAGTAVLAGLAPAEEPVPLTSGAYHGTVVPADSTPSFGSNPNQLVPYDGPMLKVKMHPVGRNAVEPTLGVNKNGTAFFAAATFDGAAANPLTHILRSKDRGLTWENVSPTIPVAELNEPPNSNDPYVYVDTSTGRVFSLDMQGVGCFYVLWSDDAGETWERNPVACDKPVVDHPTLVSGPPPAGFALPTFGYSEIVYICYNEVGDSHCARSLDGGRSFTFSGELAFPGVNGDGLCGGLHGHAVTDSAGRLFVPKGQCLVPMVAISEDAGVTFDQVVISSGVMSAEHEVTLAVDAAGNLYAVWWDGKDLLPYLSVSTDHGRTWRDPIMIAPPGVEQVNFPTIAAGAAGRIAIHFPGTIVDDRGDDERPWNAYEVVSTNALAQNPLFVFTVANDPDDPIHRGDCRGRCAGMFDFLDIVVAPREAGGAFWAAQTDTCTGACATDPSASADDAKGMAIRQVGGPMLYPPLPEDVTALVAFKVDNADFGGGTASFDLRLENTSEATLFAPLRAEITALSSASGEVTAANADNGAPGEGAFWRFDERLGGDGKLSPGETSQARNLAFNNPNREPFSVTFRVLSGSVPQGGGGASGSSSAMSAGTLIRLTVNPLLKTIEAEIL